MIKIKKELFLSSLGIFIIYILVSCLLIFAFRFIFPKEIAPIQCFSVSWRLNQGFLEFLNLFPALAMAALVIPFGLKNNAGEGLVSFSPQFMAIIKGPIITAITAAALYGLLFFLALPLTRDSEANMRYQGRLFRLSKERAIQYAEAEEWTEALRFVALCEQIWPDSPEISKLKVEVSIETEKIRFTPNETEEERDPEEEPSAAYSGLIGQGTPVSATEALAMAQTAMKEERYYDAHWLATLAGRLARPDSAETTVAARLASLAWEQVASMEPNSREQQSYALYRLKREGYEAMMSALLPLSAQEKQVSEDWIRAYYIFKELSTLTPMDPDTAKFLALSEKGATETTFFVDEIELDIGNGLTGAIFSLPARGPDGLPGGRIVLRFSSLSTFADYSYGIGVELMAFDREGRLGYRLESNYAKIVPMILNNKSQAVLLLRALDRTDKNKRWEPVKTGPVQSAADDAQTALDCTYENFLLLSKVRRSLDNLSIADVAGAEKRLGLYGYSSKVFQAEIMYRFSEPAIFLPMTILALIIAWRYRTEKRPRYMGIPMLGILPVVFNGIVHFYRGVLNDLGIWAVVSLGFSTTVFVFIIGLLILFIFSLIMLAAQHG
jgi:hypothetical protein